MGEKIRVAILDDHQSIVDGYSYRLSLVPEIEVVATGRYGEEVEFMLAQNRVDVLILDVVVPTSPANGNHYPILYLIPQLLQTYPDLAILVISGYGPRSLVKAVMEAGASGYVLKDDQTFIRELGSVVRSVAQGGICLSRQVYDQLPHSQTEGPLTPRQLRVLSLLTAYPDLTTADVALKLGVAPPTVRNLLSSAYLRLDVRNRAAAVAKAQQLGLVAPPEPNL
jgi:two-component system, NarL family, nitrate/nitrite response regulator NarL